MRVPGLTVIRANDGGIALQIRGAHSYDGSSDAPLFLLDDAEAGIYGIRGANGVILIRTKRAGNTKQRAASAAGLQLGGHRNRLYKTRVLVHDLDSILRPSPVAGLSHCEGVRSRAPGE
jgi:TonB-dependent SusC/RagA subfamily outer membrane receptor